MAPLLHAPSPCPQLCHICLHLPLKESQGQPLPSLPLKPTLVLEGLTNTPQESIALRILENLQDYLRWRYAHDKTSYRFGKTPGGADIQFEEWLARFRTYASMYSWSPQERRRKLLMHLTDSAYRLISRLIMPSDVTDEEAERLMIEKLQSVYGSTERKAFQELIALSFDPLKAHNSIDLHAAEIRELIAISLPRLEASSAEMLACRFFWNSIPWTGAARQLYCTWQSSAQDLSHALDLCRTLYDDDEHVEAPVVSAVATVAQQPRNKGKGKSTKGVGYYKGSSKGQGQAKGKSYSKGNKGGKGQYKRERLPLIHTLVSVNTLE
ncbi:hypothetical protein FOZ61_001059 [Perkinsus olseni]|uniref:Paraneoplastic antigen Ma-like C-terminal domain-containing protein n=1 Tax=Perkinsus olseni TaxID=32597 RepID=A0A7J6KRA3_PEROL|nr:hypothetical protein FOZ61_001059 [Perkinsus olseni]